MKNEMTNVKALQFVLDSEYEFPAEVIEKLEKMKASFEKKSTNRKPTAKQTENEALKAEILTILEGSEGMTASEVFAAIKTEGVVLQRVTALLTQMKNDQTVERFMEKKKALFKVAVATEESDSEDVTE